MNIKKVQDCDSYPVMPLRDVVIYPKMITPVYVGRERSIQALKNLGKEDHILLIAQKDKSSDTPKAADLYKVGVLAKVLQIIKLQDSSLKVLVEGVAKAKVMKFSNRGLYLKAKVEILFEQFNETESAAVAKNEIIGHFRDYISLSKKSSVGVIFKCGAYYRYF